MGVGDAPARRPAGFAGNRPRRQLGQPPPRRGALRATTAGPSATWRAPTAPTSTASAFGPGEQPLRPRDIVQFGKVALIVEQNDATPEGPPSNQHIVAAAPSTFEEGIRRLAFDRNQMPRAGEQLFALLRAGHHFVHIQSEDQLLDAILNDAVSVLDAQRGAIVLAEGEGPEPKFRLRALAVGHGRCARPVPLLQEAHQPLLQRRRVAALQHADRRRRVEADAEHRRRGDGQRAVRAAADAAEAARRASPRPQLRAGAVHRGRPAPGRRPGRPRLRGIESAQLLRKQRDLFLKTITILAQAVELRDDYTGGHTQRVTRYATMLAEKLELPDDQIELIRIGSPLHDIGKIGIDDAILRKPGRLTADEFEMMQTHTTMGAEILADDPRDAADHPDRAQPPRAVGRHGLPGPAGGRGDPVSWRGSWRWPTRSTR